MNARDSRRDLMVGLVIVAALAGLFGLLGVAGGGPGFLTSRKTIDVYFKDGQGIRAGSAVRIAGIDAGRVVDVELAEHEGMLRARVRITLPAALAKKLKQDAKITIQPSLTGQSRVNIVSSGNSAVPLVPGQKVAGVESTFFDPILEQAGLGPVERNHLSHTIAEIRATVDSSAPRIRQIVASLQDTATDVRESAEKIRPAIESTALQIDGLSRRINAASPKMDAALARLESLTTSADKLLTENRDNLHATLAGVRDLTATMQDIAEKNRPRAEQLLVNIDGTRARADRLLYQADILASQGVQMLAKNRADIERTISNVKDATDWADKLVQKIFANPFVLSPFYKPTPEDTRVQNVYDAAQVFTKGAQELNDSLKKLESMQARATTPEEKQELANLQRYVVSVTEKLGETSQMMAEGLKRSPNVVRTRR